MQEQHSAAAYGPVPVFETQEVQLLITITPTTADYAFLLWTLCGQTDDLVGIFFFLSGHLTLSCEFWSCSIFGPRPPECKLTTAHT